MKKTKTTPVWLNGLPFIAILMLLVLGWMIYLYIFHKESKQQPTINKIVKIEDKYELSDTLYFCDEYSISKNQYYSVYKQDSTEIIYREDICHRCGKDFGSHGTIQMWKTKDIIMQERD